MTSGKTNNLQAINTFLAQPYMAIAGVSRNSSKFGNLVWKELKKKDIHLYAVHPEMETYQGEKCFNSLDELPDKLNALFISTHPDKALELVKAAKARKIKHIWIQQGAENEEIIQLSKDTELNIIIGQCILMFASGQGIHRFHAFLLKLFKKFPV
jgi:uncharacterized protein